VKLNLKVGISISDNTDLWLTDTSYNGFGTDLEVITGKFLPACVVQKIRETFIVVYVALIKQAVVNRI
jgi:hypothetical protein